MSVPKKRKLNDEEMISVLNGLSETDSVSEIDDSDNDSSEIVLSAEKIIKEKAVHIGARTVKLLCVLFLVFVIGTLHKCK